jgi:hypothetical protein
MVLDPFWFRAGVMDKLRFEVLPELERFPSGTSVLLDEVKLIEVEQFGDESTSLKE